MEYVHKKFDIKAMPEYTHKKFGQHLTKRKRITSTLTDGSADNKENVKPPQQQSTTILDDIQPAKRHRQAKPLFRPWLIEDINRIETPTLKQTDTGENTIIEATVPIKYYPSKARCYPVKQRTPKEQQRRDRNTLACLINRQAKRANEAAVEEQLSAYRQQNALALEQSIRAALYLRHLIQLQQASGNRLNANGYAMQPQQFQQYQQQQSFYHQQHQQPPSQRVFTFGSV